MKTEQKVEIGGREFVMFRLIPEESILYHAQIMKAFGGLLNADLLNSLTVDDVRDFADMGDGDKIAIASKALTFVGQWSATIDPLLVSSIVKSTCEQCKIINDGKAQNVIFNNVFDTSIADAYNLFARFVMFELAGFFSAKSQDSGSK